LTDWDRKVYRDYIDFHGEKCLAIDPNDEVIPVMGSLAFGVG